MASRKKRRLIIRQKKESEEEKKKEKMAMAEAVAPVAADFDYEQVRNARMEENRRRMEELGLFNLSKQVAQQAQAVKKRPLLERKPRLLELNTGPTRRSSRLQDKGPAVNYSEVHHEELPKATSHPSLPEIYTEEHEKLLGSCKTEWVLFQDGYGPDGKRIYDSFKGKTCHQCRQKTLGLRTSCSKCHLVQGQFCGDCLYMRYGENVMEAKENPEWICPVCRGICNCSLCRVKKGWQPTGYFYRQATNRGFKSVAHYLILSQRASTEPTSTDTPSNKSHIEDNKNDVLQSDARRSLTFASDPTDQNALIEENDTLPKLACVETEINGSLPKLACVNKEENNSWSDVATCRIEDCSLPTFASVKKEEKEPLPNLTFCEREENDSLSNLALSKRESGSDVNITEKDLRICSVKRPCADDTMVSKAASQDDEDAEIISIKDSKQDENHQNPTKLSKRKSRSHVDIIEKDLRICGVKRPCADETMVSKGASQDDGEDVDIVSIKDSKQNENHQNSTELSKRESGSDVDIIEKDLRICGVKRPCTDEIMVSKATSQDDGEDVEMVSIKDSKQDENHQNPTKLSKRESGSDVDVIEKDLRICGVKRPCADETMLSKEALQDDDEDVEIVSIKDSKQDENHQNPTKCKVYRRGGVASRLRPRTTKKAIH